MFTCSYVFFFVKQKTAYEMRISDWSSDVCSSDLRIERGDFEAAAGVVNPAELLHGLAARFRENGAAAQLDMAASDGLPPLGLDRLQAERMFQHLLRTVLSVADAGEHIQGRSEEHTSELQSLMRISYAVFCLQK